MQPTLTQVPPNSFRSMDGRLHALRSQPCGQRGTGLSRADDDRVVFLRHSRSPLGLSSGILHLRGNKGPRTVRTKTHHFLLLSKRNRTTDRHHHNRNRDQNYGSSAESVGGFSEAWLRCSMAGSVKDPGKSGSKRCRGRNPDRGYPRGKLMPKTTAGREWRKTAESRGKRGF